MVDEPDPIAEVGPQGGFTGFVVHARGRFVTAPALVRAVTIMIGASFIFNCMNAVIRHLSTDIHPFEIAFFRNIFGLIALSPFFVRNGLAILRSDRMGLHIGRASINVVSMMCFFYAISITPLAEVASLGFSLPLFVTVYAALFMKERLRARRLLALAIGTIGAAIIVRPWEGTVNLGSILVLAGSAIWGVALLMTKVLARDDSSVTITAWAAILLAILALFPASTVWVWPVGHQWWWLALIGCFGTIGALGIAESLKLAEANALMPYDFVKLIWAALVGFIIFGEVPNIWVFVGGAIIFGSTVYLTYREAKLHKEGNL